MGCGYHAVADKTTYYLGYGSYGTWKTLSNTHSDYVESYGFPAIDELWKNLNVYYVLRKHPFERVQFLIDDAWSCEPDGSFTFTALSDYYGASTSQENVGVGNDLVDLTRPPWPRLVRLRVWLWRLIDLRAWRWNEPPRRLRL